MKKEEKILFQKWGRAMRTLCSYFKYMPNLVFYEMLKLDPEDFGYVVGLFITSVEDHITPDTLTDNNQFREVTNRLLKYYQFDLSVDGIKDPDVDDLLVSINS